MTDLLETLQLEPLRVDDDLFNFTYQDEPSRPDPERRLECSSHTAFHLLALWGIVVVGVMLRVRGLSNGGLWTSDAWVALSSRVGIGTAWHMWANAPGFDLFERSWLMLHPGSTWWGQIPPLAAGIASIPATYFMVRYFRFATWMSLGAALVVSVSPICVTYSSRYKDYSLDFLLACAVLIVVERARREPARRSFFLLSTLTITSFMLSASTLPLLVGAWLALGLLAVVNHWPVRVWLGPGILMGVVSLAIRKVFYRRLSPYLHKYWSGHFLTFRSPTAALHSIAAVTASVFNGLVGIPTGSFLVDLLVTCSILAILMVGIGRRPSMLAPALILAFAYVASALGAIPLGTGRTDEVLYPAAILILVSGVQGIVRFFRSSSRPASARYVLRVTAAVALAALLFVGMATNSTYHNVDVRTLAAEVDHNARPSDHVVVDAFLRYAWALYEEPRPHVVFGQDWMTGFSVVSTQSRVSIIPSFLTLEGGNRVSTWAGELERYKRIWLLDAFDHTSAGIYGMLLRDGFTPVHTLYAPGCEAILLQHVTGASPRSE